MTMRECYEAIGGNYEDVLGRLHSEALIWKFTFMFLENQSYLQLKQALKVELLKSEGAECDVTEDGQKAFEMFVSSPVGKYNAILMDVMMLVMDGYEATKAIRNSKHPEALTIPIVAMTANAFVKDVQDALDAGMNAHIAKPIHTEVLKNTLASCIRNL